MNVITILCDTLRRDHCNPYTGGRPKPLHQCGDAAQPDWPVPTPNIQRLADRGTVYENCWAGSTPCMPARRDIYTGRLEFLERGWGPLEEWDVSLPAQVSAVGGDFPHRGLHEIRQRGGRVSELITDHMCLWSKGSGNYHMGYTGFEFIRGHQWDNWLTDPVDADALGLLPADRGRGWYDRHIVNNARLRQAQGEQGWCAHRVMAAACDWLQRNRSHQDFYLHIDCFDPHEPWDPPRALVEQFMADAYEVPGISCHAPYCDWRQQGLSERQVRSYQARYAAMVVLVDRALGRLLDCLDQLQLWDDTLVIFTTDHGTWNGERGRVGKLGTHQFDGGAHIPLILCHPQLAHGESRAQLVQLVDLYPTTLSAVGRPLPELPGGRQLHGVDLLPTLADPAQPTREWAVTGMFGDSVSITDGSWVLHQAPTTVNAPLYWYGHQQSDFVGRGPLGPIENGRRQVTSRPYTGPPTWLSDRRADPLETVNLAADEPGQLAELRTQLVAELHRLQAPSEQLLRLGLAAD